MKIRKRIAQLAEKYQCYVIEDDIYAECSFNAKRPLPIKYWDRAGYVIYCGWISKSLSPSISGGVVLSSTTFATFASPNYLCKMIRWNTPLQLGDCRFDF